MKKYFIVLSLLAVLLAVPVSAATLSATQISAIVSLLQAFGADSQTISSVHSALTGTSGVSGGTSSTGVSQGISDNISSIKPMKFSDISSVVVTPFNTANLSFGVSEVSAQYNLGSYQQGKWYEGMNPAINGPVWVEFGWPNSPQVDITLSDQNNIKRNIYLPAVGPNTANAGWFYWIADDGSSYYANSSHGPGWANLTANQALRPEHLARRAGSSSAVPSITVTSPNGGENVVQGPQSVISWSGNQLSGVFAYLVPANSPGNGVGSLGIIGYVSSIYSSMGWDGKTVWSDLHNGTPIAVPPGSYKIYLVGNVAGASGQTVTDMSNAPFTISSGSNTVPSVTVTYPNGGQTWPIGLPQLIKWTTTNIPSSQNIDTIRLRSRVGGQEYNLFSNTSNDGNEVVIVPASIPQGEYLLEIKTYVGNTLVSDSSDSYFKITDSTTTNKPPVITGLTAPSTLNAGQSGTWVVKAYDPEGGTLAYTIDWGELQSLASKSSSVGQEASFTHSYAAAGTYKVSITVIDNAGQAAMTSATVVVGGTTSTPVPVVNVLSPNGGEIYTAGQTIPIQFSTNLTDKQSSGFVLQLYKKTTDSSGKMYSQDIVGNWAGGSPYSWTIPTTIPAGDYFIYIAALNLRDVSAKEVIDFSNGSFTISNPLTQTAATITVTSPQPNEIWRRGNVKTIMWTTTNLGTDAYIAIRAINSAGQVIDLVRKTWNSGQVGWNVGLTADGTQLPAGFYRIRACITGPTGGCDKSSEKMLEIKEKSDGTSTGTAGAVGASSPNLWNWLGKVILGQ